VCVCVCVCVYIYIYIYYEDQTLELPYRSVIPRYLEMSQSNYHWRNFVQRKY